jgi:hypothetical protein
MSVVFFHGIVADEAKASAENIGAAKFLDKMNLSRELIPAILELAPKSVASNLTSKRTYKFLQHNL